MDEKFPGEPDTVRPEWEDQRIRIEALRAATTLMSAMVSSGRSISAPGDEGIDTMTRALAKQFATYLETGE